MTGKQVYRGTVRTGRGAGVVVMSGPGVLDGFRLLTGLDVTPGTLNVRMAEPFDLALLSRFSLAEHGLRSTSPRSALTTGETRACTTVA